jgi:hypothetical protein
MRQKTELFGHCVAACGCSYLEHGCCDYRGKCKGAVITLDDPTVVSATGHVWIDRKLGASRVATSMDDEQAYGDLYQRGRFRDGREKQG